MSRPASSDLQRTTQSLLPGLVEWLPSRRCNRLNTVWNCQEILRYVPKDPDGLESVECAPKALGGLSSEEVKPESWRRSGQIPSHIGLTPTAAVLPILFITRGDRHEGGITKKLGQGALVRALQALVA